MLLSITICVAGIRVHSATVVRRFPATTLRVVEESSAKLKITWWLIGTVRVITPRKYFQAKIVAVSDRVVH
jgi:hypothetical protein